MALLDANWPLPQQVDFDGLKYDISVLERENGSFDASWFCSECSEEGVSTSAGAAPNEVLLLAHIGLSVHHQLFHSGVRRPKPK
jgi:hypothetical protein